MKETRDAVIDWLADGQVGMSSKAMAFWLGFGRLCGDSHPHDPDDLDRCLKLLALIPALREGLPRMAEVSPYRAALVARWAEVEASHLNEVGLGWSKARSAQKTYNLMQEIYAPVEKLDTSILFRFDRADLRAKVKP